jgi:hypothetical protein
MSPILQTLANGSAYGYRTLAAAGGDYESIATVTVGSGGASSISFTSIPSTYQHLQLRGITKNTSSGTFAAMRFNSDSASNYSAHYLDGDGASATAGAASNYDRSYFGYTGTSSQTNIFGVSVVDILDYKDTNKFKTVRILTGVDVNGSGGYIEFSSSSWRSTSAITDINVFFSSNNFAEYSQIALYGIKG